MLTGCPSDYVLCRVFVFADPAVFSGPLWQAVRADLVLASPQSDTLARRVLLHTLQAGLVKACHGPILTQALEVREVNGL